MDLQWYILRGSHALFMSCNINGQKLPSGKFFLCPLIHFQLQFRCQLQVEALNDEGRGDLELMVNFHNF